MSLEVIKVNQDFESDKNEVKVSKIEENSSSSSSNQKEELGKPGAFNARNSQCSFSDEPVDDQEVEC